MNKSWKFFIMKDSLVGYFVMGKVMLPEVFNEVSLFIESFALVISI